MLPATELVHRRWPQELVSLVPDLGGRLRCLRVEVLQGIWRDEAIPCKLVELKLQFLEVDVSRLVSRRCEALELLWFSVAGCSRLSRSGILAFCTR